MNEGLVRHKHATSPSVKAETEPDIRPWRTSAQEPLDRSNKRAIAGLSMGGMGAMIYAARNPKMFLAAASLSGVLDTVGGQAYTDSTGTWGDPVAQADLWKAHNPLAQADSLKGLSLFVSYGNGQAGPFDGGVVPDGDLESWIAGQDGTFVDRLKALGIPATVDAYGPGTHSWPYWERELHRAMPLLLKALGSGG